MHQALGHPPPLALGLGRYASGRWQRPIAKFENGLPTHLGPRQRCHVDGDLGSWLGITCQLLDRNPTRYLGRGFRRSVTWNLGRLIGYVLLLFGTAGWGRRRSLVLALRLLRLNRRTSAEEELVNSHFSPGHHLYVLVGLSCFWLGCLSLSFRLFNRYVDFTILRNKISQGVPY